MKILILFCLLITILSKLKKYYFNINKNELCWNVCKFYCTDCKQSIPSTFNTEEKEDEYLICVCIENSKKITTNYILQNKVGSFLERRCLRSEPDLTCKGPRLNKK